MTIITNFYAAKGGAGCSTVAATYALTRDPATRVLLVDNSPQGDLAALLGLPTGHEGEPCNVRGNVMTVRVVNNHAMFDLPDLMAAADHVVIDNETRPVTHGSHRRILVTRPCYLHLRAAAGMTRPAGIVIVREPGRALTDNDVSHALNAPILAAVDIDPAVARAIDAGLLASRIPRIGSPATAMRDNIIVDRDTATV